ELPTLVLQTGLIPALTFYLSKVEKEEVYKLVLEALEAKVDKSKLEELSEEDKKMVREEVGGEGKGYTTLLGISAYMLKQLADMYKIEKCKNINTIVGFVECLHEIRNNRGKEVILEKQFMKFMLEVKKLFDAFFREK
ncbi:MAG TPA: hypothetical protein EYP08_08690, partial [Pyrodictiaceae archaeon]|nr:hypothetical protein [Pyrodictiaceae archaeon]